MNTNLLDLKTDILNIIGDYGKKDNERRMDKEDDFKKTDFIMNYLKENNKFDKYEVGEALYSQLFKNCCAEEKEIPSTEVIEPEKPTIPLEPIKQIKVLSDSQLEALAKARIKAQERKKELAELNAKSKGLYNYNLLIFYRFINCIIIIYKYSNIYFEICKILKFVYFIIFLYIYSIWGILTFLIILNFVQKLSL
jgi:hypothetical protein